MDLEISEFELNGYAKLAGVDSDVVLEAFQEAYSILGDGYVIDYYWSMVAQPLCSFFKSGFKYGLTIDRRTIKI